MKLEEIDQKINKIFDQAVKQGIVSGVSYAVLDEGQIFTYYLGKSYQDGPELVPGILL